MIIDFRVRPPFKSFAKLRIYNPRPQNPDPVSASPLFTNIEPPYRSYEETSIDAFVEELDEAGIDVAVAMGRKAGGSHGSVPYEELVELRDLFPGRFVCFGGLNGVDVSGSLEDIDRCVDLGFKGAALDNGWSEPPMYDDDERLYPIYERCIERGLIVSLTSSIYVGPDVGYSMPVHIHRVAQQFPDLTIVVPHGAFPWAAVMCGVAFHRPNVHLIPDIYMNVPGLPGCDDYFRAANGFLSHRFLYGSSYPIRPLGQSIRSFKSLPFDNDDIRDRCLGGNAARLLGLTG